MTARDRSLVARLAAGDYAVREICTRIAQDNRGDAENAIYIEFALMDAARLSGRGSFNKAHYDKIRLEILDRRPQEEKPGWVEEKKQRPPKRALPGPKESSACDDGGFERLLPGAEL